MIPSPPSHPNPIPMRRVLTFLLPLALLLPACATGRAGPPSATADAADATDAADAGAEESYRAAIPEGAVADSGLFVLHWDEEDEELFFEIPDSLFGRDMLLVSRIAQVPAEMGAFLAAGQKAEEQVVRWERRGGRVLLRKVSYRQVADDSLPIHRSVVSNNFPPIVAAFDVEAHTPDSAAVVIEVTDLFDSDVRAISGLSAGQRRSYEVRRLDPDRTFVNRPRAYPENVDVRHTLTFEAGDPPSDANTGTISMEMHQSMVLLPDPPMRPRHADARVGWFDVTQINFGLDEQKAAEQSFICRWRLEPTDPEAYARGELVEPTEPIVYYVDPATPDRWRPYVRQGVLDWNRAFEAAGFRNAVEVRDAPSPEEDPEWSAEDVRHSVVRWAASTTRNAMGPSVCDPRTGEIIESDIVWYHNHMRSYRNRLLIETAAANPDARTLEIPDPLMGEAMRQVIAHEIGHAVGLPHNMVASSAFPVDSLRSPTFTERYGVAPSIMEYARQNYVAQPGDGVTRFIRQIGPYDLYAIEWGYRIIPEAESPEDEKPILDRWILERADDPMYRWVPQRGGETVDPRAQTEDMGDDPVRASGYAVQNLRRVVPNLIAWTSTPGEGYEDLEEIYGELVFQWRRYMTHTVPQVGGVYETLKATDQEGPVYEVVPRERQEASVRFLAEHVFRTPTWLLDPDLLGRIEHSGAVERIRSAQVSILGALLSPRRLQRMIEAELVAPERAYPPIELLDDVRAAVWSELAEGTPVDTYRRNLQRGYLERMEALLTEEPSELPDTPSLWNTPVDVSQSDIRPLVRDQLRTLRQEAAAAAGRSSDRMTRIHLADVVERVERILDPEDG